MEINNRIILTKIFSFDLAHALEGYPGKCRHIHGHTYILHVSISGPVINEPGHPYDGMIIDFGDLKTWINKEVVQEFDHTLVLRKGSKLAAMPFPEGEKTRLVLTDYQPTCENILADICRRLVKTLPGNIKIHRLKLYETPTSYAEWENE